MVDSEELAQKRRIIPENLVIARLLRKFPSFKVPQAHFYIYMRPHC
jgi:hypothetical protein